MQFGDLLYVVLAGSDRDPRIMGGIGQPSKFFLPFGGDIVGARIVRALDGSSRCRAIYVAAPPDLGDTFACPSCHPLHMVSHGPTRMGSMMSALTAAERCDHYTPGDYVLVVTGDLPLLTSSSIDRFLVACERPPEADCYIGMIPHATVDEEMRPLLLREGLYFRGQTCLHTDVFLLRPASMSGTSRRRFDSIMTIRRTGRTSVRGMLQAAGTVLQIVGVRGLAPFVRIVAALPNLDSGSAAELEAGPNRLETSVLELVKQGFGLAVCFVPIDEPALGIGFDYPEELELLVAYAQTRGALTAPGEESQSSAQVPHPSDRGQ